MVTYEAAASLCYDAGNGCYGFTFPSDNATALLNVTFMRVRACLRPIFIRFGFGPLRYSSNTHVCTRGISQATAVDKNFSTTWRSSVSERVGPVSCNVEHFTVGA